MSEFDMIYEKDGELLRLKGPERQSNFELLRIVAMFLVLIVHANFFSIGAPSKSNILDSPLSSYLRYMIEAMSLVCVNVYILISGYFGIKPNTRRVCSFVFMLIFWRLIVSIGWVIYKVASNTLTSTDIHEVIIGCSPLYFDWFSTAYLILMCIAPIINKYINSTHPKQVWTIAIWLYLLQIYFSFIDSVFDNGYSALSFVNLYLVGNAINRTECLKSGSSSKYIILYILVSLIAALAVMLTSVRMDSNFITQYVNNKFVAYNGLNVMLGSIFFFLTFKYINIKSRLINYIASSSFAVYLFHMHPLIKGYYQEICKNLYDTSSWCMYICKMAIILILIFSIAILIDKIRIKLWDNIDMTISKFIKDNIFKLKWSLFKT